MNLITNPNNKQTTKSRSLFANALHTGFSEDSSESQQNTISSLLFGLQYHWSSFFKLNLQFQRIESQLV